jgi:hypothetical protein
LEKGIVAELLRVIAVGVTGEDLINLLGKDGLTRVGDKLLSAGIGKATG